MTYAGNDYWTERSFLDRVIANYKGSVYIIQGMQDWNVDPHMSFPTHQIVEEAGIEIKTLAGQWAHDYPDRNLATAPCQAEKVWRPIPTRSGGIGLMRCCTGLTGTSKAKGAPTLGVEMQDNRGGWRIESTYPAPDTEYLEIAAADLNPSGASMVTTTETITMTYGPFEEDVFIAGMPTFHIAVTPHTANGAHGYLEMSDGNGLRLGHAVMDFRFHEGGRDGQEALVGFETVLGKMEFMAMDIFLEEGESIVITMSQTGRDYVPSPAAAGGYSINWAESTLTLPIVKRTCDDLFQVPMQDYGGDGQRVC